MMKKLLLLLLLPVCVLGQEEQADTLDLDYYLFDVTFGGCGLQAEGNPGYITKTKQIKDCLGSVDTSRHDYFRYYFFSSPIADFETHIITHRDSSIEILITNEHTTIKSNKMYCIIGLLPKGSAHKKCKLTYRYRICKTYWGNDTDTQAYLKRYSFDYFTLEPISE